MGLNPGAVFWMDIFSLWFVVKIVLFFWKRPKINKKRGRGWPIFFLKKIDFQKAKWCRLFLRKLDSRSIWHGGVVVLGRLLLRGQRVGEDALIRRRLAHDVRRCWRRWRHDVVADVGGVVKAVVVAQVEAVQIVRDAWVVCKKLVSYIKTYSQAVWPDWAIFDTIGLLFTPTSR